MRLSKRDKALTKIEIPAVHSIYFRGKRYEYKDYLEELLAGWALSKTGGSSSFGPPSGVPRFAHPMTKKIIENRKTFLIIFSTN